MKKGEKGGENWRGGREDSIKLNTRPSEREKRGRVGREEGQMQQAEV